MTTPRTVVVSLLGIASAAVAGQIMCAPLKRGILLNPLVFSFMLAFSCTAFVAFSVTRRIPSPLARPIAGIGVSYLGFALVLLAFAAIKGEVAEFMKWLPGMIVFGIPMMAPLVGISWLGSARALGARKRPVPNEAAAADR